MTEAWAWANEHWFLTFLLVYCAMYVPLNALTRTYRVILVLARGWPPEHLDADGDWKPDRKPDA